MHIILIDPSAINIMNHTNSKIWYNVVKLTSKLILLDLKLQKKNLVHIVSNVSTVKVVIKWIVTFAHSGNTDSIITSITEKLKS